MVLFPSIGVSSKFGNSNISQDRNLRIDTKSVEIPMPTVTGKNRIESPAAKTVILAPKVVMGSMDITLSIPQLLGAVQQKIEIHSGISITPIQNISTDVNFKQSKFFNSTLLGILPHYPMI